MAVTEFSFLQNHPGLRVALPLAAGVAAGDVCVRLLSAEGAEPDALFFYSLLLLGLLGGCLCLLWFSHRRPLRFPPPFRFGAVALVALFVTGALLDALAWQRVAVAWDAHTLYYKGVVSEPPREGTRSRTCRVRLTGMMTDDGRVTPLQRDVQLTLPLDSAFSATFDTLAVGRGIAFRARMERPANYGNPDEFDYADYLLRHGVSGTAFAPTGQWCTYPLSPQETAALDILSHLRIRALQWRERLLSEYAALGLKGESEALVAALTLGDRNGLTKEVKRLYTDAGANHLLALSGMNLAVFMVVFQLLLLHRWRFSRWRWVAGVVVIGFIWTYTLLTGLPSSLVRAAVMGTLCVGSYLQRREHQALNALGVAAAVMLLLNPFYLWDVGFGLSCLSLFFILVLYPELDRLFPRLRQPWRGLWRTWAVAVVAQLGTMPLVAHLFHQCAPYAALWSVVLVPATSLTVYALLGLLGLHFMGAGTLVAWGATGLSAWVQAQLSVLEFSVSLPGAVCKDVFISTGTTVWLYGALLCVAPFYPLRARWRVMAVVGCLLLAAGAEVVNRRSERLQPQVVFYHNRRAPGMELAYDAAHAYVLTARPDSFVYLSPYLIESSWVRRFTDSPRMLAGEYRDSLLTCTDGLLCAPGVTVLQVADDRWLHRKADEVLAVDYLHVCRGFKGHMPRLAEMFRPELVVLDASLTDYYLQRYRAECAELGWKVHVMREQGALKMPLRGAACEEK